jgi:hypothetical protein
MFRKYRQGIAVIAGLTLFSIVTFAAGETQPKTSDTAAPADVEAATQSVPPVFDESISRLIQAGITGNNPEALLGAVQQMIFQGQIQKQKDLQSPPKASQAELDSLRELEKNEVVRILNYAVSLAADMGNEAVLYVAEAIAKDKELGLDDETLANSIAAEREKAHSRGGGGGGWHGSHGGGHGHHGHHNDHGPWWLRQILAPRPVIYSPVVYQQPVYPQPVYSPPVYSQPVYQNPYQSYPNTWRY